MNFIQWLAIPITAYASLNTVPVTPSKTPLLGENTPYVIDYPVDHSDSLTDAIEPVVMPQDKVKTLLQEYFPQNWQTMYEIAKAESSLRPDAYNPESHKTCNGSYGILQVGCNNYSGDPTDLFDLETNIKTAKKVYDSQGYGAWGVCTKNIVQCGILE